MAQRLKKFGRDESVSYPWNEWLDGEIWEARVGRDFFVRTQDFKSRLYQKSRSTKRPVKMKSWGAGIVQFQFLPEEEQPKKKRAR